MCVFKKFRIDIGWLFGFSMILVLAAASLAEAGERLAVSVPIANIRSGPGPKYDIIWNVEKYHPIVTLEKKGRWYRFKDFENDEGWIYDSLVKKIKAVITKKAKCNVRSAPNTKASIVFTVEKGIPFKVIKTKGSWINIEHSDGDRGWIFKSLVW